MRRVASQLQSLVVIDDKEIEVVPVAPTEIPPTQVDTCTCAAHSEQTLSRNGGDNLVKAKDAPGFFQLAP